MTCEVIEFGEEWREASGIKVGRMVRPPHYGRCPMIQCSLLLRRALWADAVASSLLGLPMAFATATFTSWLQLPEALLCHAGLFSIVYGLFVGWMASRETLPRALVMVVIVGNALWTLGSAALLAGQIVSPNGLGYLFVAVQAAAVGVFAELQFIGLRRSARATPATA
jgi:hypothetical protein